MSIKIVFVFVLHNVQTKLRHCKAIKIKEKTCIKTGINKNNLFVKYYKNGIKCIDVDKSNNHLTKY